MTDATPERDIAHRSDLRKAPRKDLRTALRTEHVFGDLRPFSQCHASTLVALPERRLLVAWFGGTREGHTDVGIWAAERRASGPESDGASDGSSAAAVSVASAASSPSATSETTPAARRTTAPGANWSEPRRIAKVADEPHWNPVLFALAPGGSELVLHFKVGSRIREWETWMQRSDDGGRSWSAAVRLVPGDRGGRGAVRNKPIRLASGDWLAGASLERWRRWDSFVDRSPNGLDAWQPSPLIPIDRKRFEGKGLIQPTLWESAPDQVHALFRSTDGRAHRSDSTDDGRSWSPAYPIDVPNNNSGLDVVRLRDGDSDGLLALACNPVAGNWAARTPLSILFSRDNGESWPERLDLETDPGEFSYPAIIETEEGLAVSYTWNRRRIAVARLVAPIVAPAPHVSG